MVFFLDIIDDGKVDKFFDGFEDGWSFKNIFFDVCFEVEFFTEEAFHHFGDDGFELGCLGNHLLRPP